MLSTLVLCVSAAALCAALPSGFSQTYLGNINSIDNLLDLEFLPNGYALIVGRKGTILIVDPTRLGSPSVYLDLTPYTYTQGTMCVRVSHK